MVKRTVTVTAIVTEEFKQRLAAELKQAADDQQRRIDQMDFQGRRLIADIQKTDLSQAMGVRQRLETEKSRQEAVKREYLERVGQVSELEIDSRFPYNVVEGFVEVKVGDNLADKLQNAEMVVKDGVIIEVREP
ncbi:hypothetical protein AMK68_04215 [candidate division KD3-62 bacterium DG_56]|uniref:16S rRNA processing protein RimM n=1 Tax=candidate division KD3-62 bacterium DG_56 TaxID=1704032 RepID=A0A0S7XKW0_9BACT|nr:MAG: hypothetical protein AMK68_04215 [candidate division KD3-62 bacterium DG_56]